MPTCVSIAATATAASGTIASVAFRVRFTRAVTGVDAADFTLLARYIAASFDPAKFPGGPPLGDLAGLYEYGGPMPYPRGGDGMKYDLCEEGALSTDQPSHLYTEYVTASYARRAEIRLIVRDWVAGWTYTLAGGMNTANALGYFLGALATPWLMRRLGPSTLLWAGALLARRRRYSLKSCPCATTRRCASA